jgi:hypothetical protein
MLESEYESFHKNQTFKDKLYNGIMYVKNEFLPEVGKHLYDKATKCVKKEPKIVRIYEYNTRMDSEEKEDLL